MTSVRPLALAVLYCVLDGCLLWAAEAKKDASDKGKVSYKRDIRPIFQHKCQGCHQPARPKGEYIMTTRDEMLKPGKSEKPGVVPGKPEQSLLVEQLISQNGKPPKMPKGKRRPVAGGAPGRFEEVQIWDVATKKLKLSLAVTNDTVYGARWSPDGSKLSFGCADNTVRAIEAATGKRILYQGAHNDWVLD